MTKIQQIEAERNEYAARRTLVQKRKEKLAADRKKIRETMHQLRFVEKLTLDAIGRRYGISRQRVHQILSEVTNKRS